VRIAGEGRPTLLLHGFASTGESWFRWGLAQRLVAQGRRVIAPDFRAHGQSDAPERTAAYPKDVLALDQEALLRALGVGAYDVVAYSMGALVAVRMLVRGAAPGHVALGGMGDARVEGVTARDAMFRDAAANGGGAKTEGARRIAQVLAKSGLNGPAILSVLDSLGRTPPAELKRLTTPVLVVCGEDDNENGSAEGLAAALGNARALRVPGAHGTTPQTDAFQDAVTGFLGRP
jgi:pimeloyl-ACP methyl ester carboxylesterase